MQPEHLAMVAVKNHHNAVTNPMAHLRFEVTIEQVLAAPRVVGPFGLLDCTPQSDGAAALILAAGDVVDRYTDSPVWVRGVGLGLDRVMHATQGGHDDLPGDHPRRRDRPMRWPASALRTSTSPRCTTASPASN